MKIKKLVLIFFTFFCDIVFAFPCYFTLVKGQCWLNYDVSVKVMDANTEKNVAHIIVPKGKLWERTSFQCEPAQRLYYTATFNPEIWAGDSNVVYRTKQYKLLPKAPTVTEAAWNIQACFPDEFSNVPIPIKGSGNCSCDFNKVPPIQPIPSH